MMPVTAASAKADRVGKPVVLVSLYRCLNFLNPDEASLQIEPPALRAGNTKDSWKIGGSADIFYCLDSAKSAKLPFCERGKEKRTKTGNASLGLIGTIQRIQLSELEGPLLCVGPPVIPR